MFRVKWIQAALDDLALVWTQADSPVRKAITAAAHRMDQQLAADPYADTESRGDDDRVGYIAPLGFEIEIDLDARIVWVLQVWRVRQRGE